MGEFSTRITKETSAVVGADHQRSASQKDLIALQISAPGPVMAFHFAGASKLSSIRSGRPICHLTHGLAAVARPRGRSRHVVVTAAKVHYKVVIVGGGSAGATVAAHYARKCPGQVAVVEPSNAHYYAPLWTLVGGGFKDIKESVRPERDVLPKGVDWVQSAVSEFQPESSRLTLREGKGTINYDYLIVATGKQMPLEAAITMYDHGHVKAAQVIEHRFY